MFNWFRRTPPRCPVNPEQQRWIERRMNWLAEQFGIDRLRTGTIVLPTTVFFPDNYQVRDEDLRGIVATVAGFMDVPAERVAVNYFRDEHPEFSPEAVRSEIEADADYQVYLDADALGDPFAVVSMLAHELARQRLLRTGGIEADDDDLLPLTDLLSVFLGMGVVCANAAVGEANFGWFGWAMQRRGYLSLDEFGYALALLWLARGEDNAKWPNYLRPDVHHAWKQGVRYVRETGDCEFRYARGGAAD